jgi:hypothetical protein
MKDWAQIKRAVTPVELEAVRARRKFFTAVANSGKFNEWQPPADLGAAIPEAVRDLCSQVRTPS